MIKHILTALSAIITIGSVGAYERDYISTYQFVTQVVIAGVMAIIAYVMVRDQAVKKEKALCDAGTSTKGTDKYSIPV